MTLKKCPTCNRAQTTKNSTQTGRDTLAVYFNCRSCHSTFVLLRKDWELVAMAMQKELSDFIAQGSLK